MYFFDFFLIESKFGFLSSLQKNTFCVAVQKLKKKNIISEHTHNLNSSEKYLVNNFQSFII